MKRIIPLLLTLITLAGQASRAERYYYFDHLKTTDGLPSNTIFDIAQDKSGFIWIGTRDGLCRYDGHRFQRISEITPEHKMNSTTFAITEDASGKIWFSSSTGIGYYDPYTDDAGTIGLPGGSTIMKMMADSRGNVWMASGTLFRYDTINAGMHTYSFDDSQPSMIVEDSLGSIWILDSNGSLYIYDRLNDTFTPQDCEKRFSIIEPTQGSSLLVATTDNDVLLMDNISMKFKTILKSEGGRKIRCMKERETGEFWIGTDSGLFIRREHESYSGNAYHDESTPASISADLITCIDSDKTGNIWIGTFYTGVNIWKNTDEEMAIYFQNPSPNTIKGKIVRSITPDEDGTIWFCTEDGWLNSLDPKNQISRNFQIKKNLNMHSLIMDGDFMWVCSYGDGVYLYDYKSEKVMKHYDIQNNFISCGIKTKNGEILIGTQGGLYLYEAESDSFVKTEEAGKDHIQTIYQDKRGYIWIGTYGSGIYCLDRDRRFLAKHKDIGNGLTSRFITSFFEDSKNRMWITTEGGGICVSESGNNIQDLNFTSITREDGLSSNVTCAAAEDSDGTIWVSTTNGITSISGATLKVTGHLNGGNGITGYQYSYGAVYSALSGIMYFGNTEGMIAIMPSKMQIL